MNLAHRWLCASSIWRAHVRTDLLPWALQDLSLGRHVLEIGPGPGVTTDLLRQSTDHVTCVEIDPRTAHALAIHMAGLNVTVRCESAARMSVPDAAFDSAACFTMLHHVPSIALQDQLLREVARVVRPGGVFVGIDSLANLPMRVLHLFDTMVAVDPTTLPQRLTRAGFTDIRVDILRHAFRFEARRPSI